MNSLFTDLPTTLTEEVVTVLAENQHVRIDRIVGGCSAISANWAMLTVVKKANRLWGVWKRMVWADQYLFSTFIDVPCLGHQRPRPTARSTGIVAFSAFGYPSSPLRFLRLFRDAQEVDGDKGGQQSKISPSTSKSTHH